MSASTCVNTPDGWREVKVGLFSKRKFGNGVLPDQWEDRELPKPKVMVVTVIMLRTAKRMVEIARKCPQDIVFSVECGTIEQAKRILEHLKAIIR